MFWWTLRGGNDVFEFANNKNVLLVYLTAVIKKFMIIYLTFAWTSTQGAFLPWYKIWTRVTAKAAFAPSYPSSQSVLLSNDRAPNSTFETVSTTVSTVSFSVLRVGVTERWLVNEYEWDYASSLAFCLSSGRLDQTTTRSKGKVIIVWAKKVQREAKYNFAWSFQDRMLYDSGIMEAK